MLTGCCQLGSEQILCFLVGDSMNMESDINSSARPLNSVLIGHYFTLLAICRLWTGMGKGGMGKDGYV